MKKAISMLLLALAAYHTPVSAQNVALGERAPEVKVQSWILDRAPGSAPMTYVEFFHSSCSTSVDALKRLKSISEEMGTELNVVVVTTADDTASDALLRPYISRNMFAGTDPNGRLFKSYGVTYVPFGVLLDSKGRALWAGNTLKFTSETIKNLK